MTSYLDLDKIVVLYFKRLCAGLTLIPDLTSESVEDEESPTLLLQYNAFKDADFALYLENINEFLAGE